MVQPLDVAANFPLQQQQQSRTLADVWHQPTLGELMQVQQYKETADTRREMNRLNFNKAEYENKEIEGKKAIQQVLSQNNGDVNAVDQLAGKYPVQVMEFKQAQKVIAQQNQHAQMTAVKGAADAVFSLKKSFGMKAVKENWDSLKDLNPAFKNIDPKNLTDDGNYQMKDNTGKVLGEWVRNPENGDLRFVKSTGSGGTSFQEKGVTQKGGFTVSYDPKEAKNFVTHPDGTKEPYDPQKHGKILGTALSQTTVINQAQQASVPSFDKWSKEDKEWWFERAKQNPADKPDFGWGKDAAKSRAEFSKELAHYARGKGISGGEMAAQKADFKTDQQAQAKIKQMDSVVNVFTNKIESNSKTIMALEKKYGNQWSRLENMPINALSGIMGSGDLQALKLALVSTSNEIAKVESGSLGVAEVSVEQARIMKKIHDANLSVKDMKTVLDAGITLGGNAKKANQDELKRLRDKMSGKSNDKQKLPEGWTKESWKAKAKEMNPALSDTQLESKFKGKYGE